MKKNKGLLILITVVFISAVIYLIGSQADNIVEFPLEIVVTSDENTEIIKAWEKTEGDYYFFLPGYAKLDKSTIKVNTHTDIILDGELITDAINCTDFAHSVPYELSYVAWGKKHTVSLTFIQSANVPAMYIKTQSGDMDYVHEEKGNEESGTILVYTKDGDLDYRGNLESIKGRGNFTWLNYEKKPYSLKLTEVKSLLGMGISQRWVLLANAGDASNIRNKLIYDFADSAGLKYSPDSQWVDLYLNGEYAGLYLLAERNEVTESRVDILENNSFLISQEVREKLDSQNITYALTDAKQSLRIHYPLVVDASVISSIESIMQSVENSLLSETGIDPITGKKWDELVDVDSWVKKYLIEEIFGNGDAGSISQFYYYDASDPTEKVYAGPVWDYDRTMGNPVAWQLQSYNIFYANRLHVNPGYDTPWLFCLCQKEAFSQAVAEQYSTVFLPLLKQYLEEEIDSYTEWIYQAAQMNELRWGYVEENYSDSIDNMIQYMNARIEFLNKVWLEKRPYYRVLANQSMGNNYANYIIFSGESFFEPPDFENSQWQTFKGWYYKDSNEPFDITKPITENIEIYAKWEDKDIKTTNQILKLIPLGVIAMMGLGLLISDLGKPRRS